MTRSSFTVDKLKAKVAYACVGGPFGSNLTQRDYRETGVPVIRGANLPNDQDFLDDNFVFVSEQKADELISNTAYPGDVIFTQRGTLGQVGIIPLSARYPRYIVSQSQMKLTVDPVIAHPKYVYYYFRQPHIAETVRRRAITSGVPHINLGILKSFEVTLFERYTQNKIVSIIDNYSELIANNARRIAQLERSARLLFEEWFVRLRYPGYEHKKFANGIPQGWMKKKLIEVAETNKENYSARNLPAEISYVDISAVKEGKINSRTRLNSSEAPGRARRIARDGDVIWSNVRPNLRQYALVLGPEPDEVFSTGFTVLTAKKVPFSFLYIATTTDNFVAHLVNFTTGVSYPAVRSEDFECAELLVPTKPLLEMFHNFCEPTLRQCKILSDQNVKLSQARDLILPRLMDGRISV